MGVLKTLSAEEWTLFVLDVRHLSYIAEEAEPSGPKSTTAIGLATARET